MAGRAFTPPDTLSQDDTRTLADVRRAVWINGFVGMIGGAFTGSVGHLTLSTLQKKYVGGEASSGAAGASASAGKASQTGLMHKILKPLPPLGKNTFMLCLMGGGALGSFVLSTTAGKNAVHLLHPIFAVGREEHPGQSPYQIAISKAKEREAEMAHTTTQSTTPIIGEDELDAAHHRSRSLRRKASMKRRLENGHSLSDTHGSTWPHENEETEEVREDRALDRAEAWGRRQNNRRNTVRDRIEKGHGLSNSTGGHWSEGE